MYTFRFRSAKKDEYVHVHEYELTVDTLKLSIALMETR